MLWNFLSRRQKSFLKLCEWRKKNFFTYGFNTNWWGDLQLYDLFMQGSWHSIFFVFFSNEIPLFTFLYQNCFIYQFHVSSVWDLRTGKKESFWVNPSLISFCSLIFYFVFLIFFIVVAFCFWQTKRAHEKKKINIWEQKIQTTYSGQLQTVFALCAF